MVSNMLWCKVVWCLFAVLPVVARRHEVITVGDTDYAGFVEGDSVCLMCSLDVPCDLIKWNRGNASCISNQSAMCISNLMSNDTDGYWCFYQQNESDITKIEVFGADSYPIFWLDFVFLRYHNINYLLIDIKIIRIPGVFTVDWTSPSTSVAHEEGGITFNKNLRSIVIANRTEADYGNYTVRVTNTLNNRTTAHSIICDDELPPGTTAEEQPIGPVLNDVYAFPGQAVSVTCDVRGMSYKGVHWRYAQIDENENLFNLTSIEFNHLNLNDETTYPAKNGKSLNRLNIYDTNMNQLWIESYDPCLVQCAVYNNVSRHAIANVYIKDLYVRVHPEQIFAGNTTSIQCYVYTDQPNHSTIRLYKNDVEVTGTGVETQLSSQILGNKYVTELKFEDIRLTDAGRYKCVTEMVTGQRDVEVFVFDAPKLVTSNHEDLVVELGQTLTLACKFTGYPAPRVEWSFKNTIVSNESTSQSSSSFRTFLEIAHIDEARLGLYTCRAENKFGQTMRQINVKLRQHRETTSFPWIMLICALFLFAVLLGISILFYRRERQKRIQLQEAGIAYFVKGNAAAIDEEISIVDQADLLPYDTRFDFPKHKLTLGRRLGSGAFGDVFLGEALGITPDVYMTRVAVKCVKNIENTDDIKSLIAELKIMIHYGKHMNVLQLLGVVRENLSKRELLVITEFCKFGNVREYLRNNRTRFVDVPLMAGHLDTLECNESTRACTTTDLVCWSFQVAQGMNYLATKGILHGDLAARNVLLTDDNMIRICDFGFSRQLRFREDYQKQTDGALPLKWMAIESIEANTFNSSTDVWAFGVVMWELFSLGASPYVDVDIGDLLAKLQSGHRLAKPTFAHPDLYDIMLDCWNVVSTERPRFAELATRLGECLPTQLVQKYYDRNAEYSSFDMDMNRRSSVFRKLALPNCSDLAPTNESIEMDAVPDTAEIQMEC